MRTLIKIILLIGFLILSGILNGQKQDYSTIYFYRSPKFVARACNANLFLNRNPIGSLRVKSKIKYKVYSEGKLTINVSSKCNMKQITNAAVMHLENGKDYYIEIELSLNNIEIFINPPNAKSRYEKIKKKREVVLEENTNIPIIEKKTYVAYKEVERSKDEDTGYKYKATSDIDKNIPVNDIEKTHSFALIIGNEDYKSHQTDLDSEANVEFARNDAHAFKDYLIKTLGVPERNITFLLDATYGSISQALSKIQLLTKNTGGNATIYFFYAGHGLPDEKTKEPYLMPVDISGTNIESAIKLESVYNELTKFTSKQVLVFLDACFSGGGRNEGLLAVRGVKIKPKDNFLKGNIVVFSSSSGNQSSLPYKEKEHGIFTYFLLKKIKETEGHITLDKLADFLKKKISVESILINNKEQTPQVKVGQQIIENWKNWKLVE